MAHSRKFAGDVAVLLLSIGGLLPECAHAQFSRDPALNLTLRQISGTRSMGDMLMDAAKSGIEVRNMIKDLNARIAGARQRYWAAYPNGPDFDAAKRELETLLHSKDFS